jgi:hypothetical protein
MEPSLPNYPLNNSCPLQTNVINALKYWCASKFPSYETFIEDHKEIIPILTKNPELVISFKLPKVPNIDDNYFYFIHESEKEKALVPIGGITGEALHAIFGSTIADKDILRIRKSGLSSDLWDKALFERVKKVLTIKKIDTEICWVNTYFDIDIKSLFGVEKVENIITSLEKRIKLLTNIQFRKDVKYDRALLFESLNGWTKKEDNMSHYLMIFFVAPFLSEQSLKLFIKNELELARYLLTKNTERQMEIDKIIDSNQFTPNITVTKVTDQNLYESVVNGVKEMRLDTNAPECDDPIIYELPFEKCLKSVSTRSVYLKSGTAYFDSYHCVELLLEALGDHMLGQVNDFMTRPWAERWLEKTNESHPDFNNIIGHCVNLLSIESVQRSNKRKRVEDIDRKHMAPCIAMLDKVLHTKHHLVHLQRLDLGGYLRDFNVDEDGVGQYMTSLAVVEKSQILQYKFAGKRNSKKYKYYSIPCHTKIEGSNRGTEDNYSGCLFNTKKEKIEEILKTYTDRSDYIKDIEDIAKKGDVYSCTKACALTCTVANLGTKQIPENFTISNPADFLTFNEFQEKGPIEVLY